MIVWFFLANDSRTGSAKAATPIIKAPIVTSSHALEPAVRRHVARDLTAANDCYADAAIDYSPTHFLAAVSHHLLNGMRGDMNGFDVDTWKRHNP